MWIFDIVSNVNMNNYKLMDEEQPINIPHYVARTTAKREKITTN